MVGAAGGYMFVQSERKSETSLVSEATVVHEAPEVFQAATRSDRKLFAPETPDEELSPEVWRFIELAQGDARLAFEYAKEQPGEINRFLKKAVEALADRDLPAADRFLEVVEALDLRRDMIAEIAGSRIRRSFEEGVGWVDSLPRRTDRLYVLADKAKYQEWQDFDYVNALSFAKSEEVREFLVEEACKKAENEDEEELERIAASLVGGERDMALTHVASLLLQRGDERAFEVLEEIEGEVDYMFGVEGIVMRGPEPLLNWLMENPGGSSRYNLIGSLMKSWDAANAEAAAKWWQEQSPASRKKQGILWKTPRFCPVTERLLKK